MTPFGPVRTRRTYEEALEEIVAAVRAGDLRVGDRPASERALAGKEETGRVRLPKVPDFLVSQTSNTLTAAR